MTIAQLKEELKNGYNKYDTNIFLHTENETLVNKKNDRYSSNYNSLCSGSEVNAVQLCTFLILDEDWYRFQLNGWNLKKTVCRLLSFLFA